MSHRVRVWLSGIAGLLISASVGAATLLVNTDFDSDLAGWTVVPPPIFGGNASWDGAAGDPANGSARFSAPNNFANAQINQCVDIQAQSVDFAFRLFVDSWSAPDPNYKPYFEGTLYLRDQPGCTGNALTTPPECFAYQSSGYHSPAWTEIWRSCTLPAGTKSVLVSFLAVVGLSGSISAHLDHVRFGPAGTVPVTLQQFDVE